MTTAEVYVWVVLGIAISIVLPLLRKSLPKPPAEEASIGGALARLVAASKPYLIVAAFSMVTALLLTAFLGDTITDWRVALLVGYAWDSTLQKLKG